MSNTFDERDALTCLFSRQAAMGILHKSLEHNGQVALLFCDVDQLRYLNVEFGHERGDAELQRIARDLERTCAPYPVYRFGGDEFLVILPEHSLEQARQMAERILASQPPFVVLHDGVRPVETLSLSIGFALFPTHALSAEKLFWAADIALLKAKRGGRLPDGMPYSGRNRALTWGDFLDEFPHQSAEFLNSNWLLPAP